MSDYISREAAIQAICNQCEANGNCGHTCAIVCAIEPIPAADVRPVSQGKWIPDYDYAEYDFDGSTPLSEPRKFQDGWQCSLCGGYMPSETNFCPNCGADMREEI